MEKLIKKQSSVLRMRQTWPTDRQVEEAGSEDFPLRNEVTREMNEPEALPESGTV